MAALLVLCRLAARQQARARPAPPPPAPRPSPRRRRPRRRAAKKSKGKPIDNAKRCRACLKDGTIPIFDSHAESIAENIRSIGEVELNENDDFPKSLCVECHDLLQAAVKFKQRMQKSEKILRELKPRLDSLNNFHIDEMDITRWDDEEIKEEPQKKVQCKRCLLDFSSMSELQEHRLTEAHLSNRAKCQVCQMECAKSYLDIHMTKYHLSVQPFVCDVCGKTFPVKSAYNIHRVTHTDELPFLCSECPYRGRVARSLRIHMRIHTGEKPYECPHCPRKFINNSNMRVHIRSAHQTTFDFKCDQCDKGFHTMGRLKEHLKVDHTGLKEHKCPYCGKEFGYRKKMMKHTRTVHQRAAQQWGRMPLYLKLAKKMEEENNLLNKQSNQAQGSQKLNL